ncbi:hypothetical protein GC197_03065 [bacterium]|nr:hypothetical protein [bacterium]
MLLALFVGVVVAVGIGGLWRRNFFLPEKSSGNAPMQGLELGTQDGEDISPETPYVPLWQSAHDMIVTGPKVELKERELTVPFQTLKYKILLPPNVKTEEAPSVIAVTDTLGLGIQSGAIDRTEHWKSVIGADYRKIKQILIADKNALVYQVDDPKRGDRSYEFAFNIPSGHQNFRIFHRDPADEFRGATLEECQIAAKIAMSIKVQEPKFDSPLDVLKFYHVSYLPEDAAGPQDVTELTFPELATAPLFAMISDFPNVEKLTFKGLIVEPESFDHIAMLSKLKDLRFNAGIVSEYGFQQVMKLKQLEVLQTGTLEDAEMDQLPGLVNLKQLAFDTRVDTKDALAFLKRMRGLEAVSVDFGGEIPVEAMTNITELVKLKRLGVGGVLKDKDLPPLANCPGLEVLRLVDKNQLGSELTDKAMEPIGKLTGLRQLQIDFALPFSDDNYVSPLTAAGLGKLSNLRITRLVLTDLPLDKPIATAVAAMKNLQRIDLEATSLDHTGLEQIAAMKGLKQIHLERNNQLLPEAIKIIQQANPNVKIETEGVTSITILE